MRRRIAGLLLAALALGLAFGCAADPPEEEEGLLLWFPVDSALEDVSSVLDTCPYQETGQSILDLMSALLAGPEAEELELTALAPTGTRVLSWSLEDGVANVELSAAYAELVGVDLTLADACITLTLAQLPGVEGVRITVNGGGLSYRERRTIYPGDVLFSGAEEAPMEVTAALYFRREGGDSLGFEWRRFRLAEGSIPAKEVLTALIAGPEDKGLLPLLPGDLTVRSAWVEEGTCTADLSAQLLDLPESERALAISSIVETLCSLDTVDQVQLLIEGKPVEEFGRPLQSAMNPERSIFPQKDDGLGPTP